MSQRYINREKSWLNFNARVLDEALDEKTPLLDRLRFLSIFTTNLDEFFMVRIAGLLKMREEGLVSYDSPESIDSSVLISDLRARTLELTTIQHQCLTKVIDQLRPFGVKVCKMNELEKDQQKFLDSYFRDYIFPVLTPLAHDAAHPFPFLSNLSLYLIVTVDPSSLMSSQEGIPKLCFVEIPTILSRLIALPIPKEKKEHQFVLIEDVIAANLDRLFSGIKVKSVGCLRVTRNLDYTLLENAVVDLLKSITKEMVLRQQQEVVRLEVQDTIPDDLIEILKEKIRIGDESIYKVPSPIYVPSFTELCNLPIPELRYEAFNPRLPARFDVNEDIFSLISQEDILVHHPYESFYTVTEFLKTAAHDQNVLAIKQMLYRTGGDSPIIQSLIEAAEQGKQVTAVVELRARFDEKNNIIWARELERAGVNVIFGFVDLKTHSKATLVVRREGKELHRYVHLSTGNYNSVTAKLYTDVGLFTKDRKIGEDATQLFNLVTGVNIFRIAKTQKQTSLLPKFNDLSIAPFSLRTRMIELIDREISEAKAGRKAKILAKMNALVDKAIIDKLYEASEAGVKINLIVRGICCLRPGVEGVSDNIEVISIIDRFLEHSRIFYFWAAGEEEVYLSSADWMPRNMDRRIEVFWPVKAELARRRLIDEILSTCWKDNVKARVLGADGKYRLRQPKSGEVMFRSQSIFIEMAREGGLKLLPYDKTLKHDLITNHGRRPVQKRDKRKRGKN